MDSSIRPPEPRVNLHYPFEQPPEVGHSFEVVPGVHWIRMPLPFALDHINLWAIEDGDGWTLVDTGLRNEQTAQAWRTLFASRPDDRPLKRIIVTHMHPDHVGMAGWLTRKFSIPMWMTAMEYLNCRVLVSDMGREAPPDAIEFYCRAGWSPSAIETYRARFGNFGKFIHPLPDSYRRIEDGQQVRIGDHDWEVVVGNGHSSEHASLYCPGLKLFISGDQVLPRISSNVSVYPLEPEANPMAGWLASLQRIGQRVPDDVLVLPAHNLCFRGLHLRLDNLIASQHRSLDRLLDRLAAPKRAIDVFGALFARAISEEDVALLGMATGESIACLNYLVQKGQARAKTDEQGVLWYEAA